MSRPRLVLYCQHVLGIGHLIRSLALIDALKASFDVTLLNGGRRSREIALPTDIEILDLPALEMDEEFAEFRTGEEDTLETIQRRRRNLILETWEQRQPDILLIELFPFGRKRFAPELLPVLARNRLAGFPSTVVCSLRDILVTKSDQLRHEAWVCHVVNRYFDRVLVHADPAFQTLDDTFAHLRHLECPVDYTGFVIQPEPTASDPDLDRQLEGPALPLIVVSIGGGRVGLPLVTSAIDASLLLQHTTPHRLLVFTGPQCADDQFRALESRVAGHSGIILRRYTPSLLRYLHQADLSISMAGYNTCMNIATAGVPALVLPFTGHGNAEQTLRAHKLERAGIVEVLRPQDLEPTTLCQKMLVTLTRGRSSAPTMTLDTHGATRTVHALQSLITKPARLSFGGNVPAPRRRPAIPAWLRPLTKTLHRLEAESKTVQIFLRDDDVDRDDASLRQLLDIVLSRQVPMSLAVIPGTLTDDAIWLLKDTARAAPSLLEIHQHGWRHVNHEATGRKCEFGPSRSYHEQFWDLARGKAIMEQAFPQRFFPAFTPPWNRCTEETYRALDALRFSVLSKAKDGTPVSGHDVQEISITLDLYSWKGGARMNPPEALVASLVDQFAHVDPIGLLLHHQVMDDEAMTILDLLLRELTASPMIAFQTLESLSRQKPATLVTE